MIECVAYNVASGLLVESRLLCFRETAEQLIPQVPRDGPSP